MGPRRRIGRRERQGGQQATPFQLAAKLRGQGGAFARAGFTAALVQPGAPKLAAEGQQAQADAEAHEQLQAEFQHVGFTLGRLRGAMLVLAVPKPPDVLPVRCRL